jgi:Uma2 family endonuclease
MDISEQTALLANAISEAINHLATLHALRAEPRVITAEELSAWRKAIGELQSSLKVLREGHIEGCVLMTSPPVSDAQVHCIEELATQLAAVAPGEHLPAALFDQSDLAWVELVGTKGPPEGAPAPSAPQPSATPMSLEAWASMPEDAPGELVDGHLMEEETPNAVHEAVVSFLGAALRRWVEPQGGFVAGREAKLAVRGDQGRRPDLSVVLPGSSAPAPRGLLRLPPDIAIEVLSPTAQDARRDRVEKVRDYAAFGVRWYWLLDPALRTLEVLELGPGRDRRYLAALAATEGSVSLPGCAGLTLDLDALWADLDPFGPRV